MPMTPLLMVMVGITMTMIVNCVNGLSATGGPSLHQLASDVLMVRPAAFGFNEQVTTSHQTTRNSQCLPSMLSLFLVD
jgi:hypothetical protein